MASEVQVVARGDPDFCDGDHGVRSPVRRGIVHSSSWLYKALVFSQDIKTGNNCKTQPQHPLSEKLFNVRSF